MVHKIGNYSLENPASIFDEEAMTALELAGRTAAKVNECVEKVNEIPARISDNVNEHIENGHFDAQISEYAGGLESRLNNLLGEVKTGSTTMDAEIIDARLGADGKSYANLGEAIRAATSGHYRELTTSGLDLNGVVEADTYVVGVTNAQNSPLDGAGILLVNTAGGNRWIMQTIFPTTFKDKPGVPETVYTRLGINTSFNDYKKNFSSGLSVNWCEWVNMSGVPVTITEAGIDLDTVNKTGDYIIGVTDSVNAPPISGGFILRVDNHHPYVVQEARTITEPIATYSRVFRVDGDATRSDWALHETASNAGQVIVNFGDSIFDFEEDGVTVSSELAALTGATCINMGFEGMRMTAHENSNYAPFSMCNLAKAIATGNFSPQLAVVDNAPAQFAKRLEELMEIDFNKVDIVTMCYGSNDYTAGVQCGTPTSNGGLYQFCSAYKIAINYLQGIYPNLRIVIVPPTYRVWFDSEGDIEDDCESLTFGQDEEALPVYVEGAIAVGKSRQCPVVDSFYGLGINNTTARGGWFRSKTDGTHHSVKGKKALAKAIAKTIKFM